jgi:hypothetical protein
VGFNVGSSYEEVFWEGVMHKKIIVCLLAVLLTTCACVIGIRSPTPTPQPTPTSLPTATDLPTATNTITVTLTPEPTLTPTLIPTDTTLPTDTITATPLPAATVKNNANLREGPDVIYPVIISIPAGSTLIVLERNDASDWFKVTDQKTGKTGWVSIKVIEFTFDPQALPIATDIPPTPSAVPYTLPPAATSTSELPLDVHLSITNNLSVPLSIYLQGPATYHFTIQAGDTSEVDVASGSYHFVASAYGYVDLTGDKDWAAGSYTWDFTPAP